MDHNQVEEVVSMNYEQVLSHITGVGIQEYDQGEEAGREHIDIHGGVCRALVIEWLRAKKTNVDFWANRGTINQGLLDDSNRIQSAIDLQSEYQRVSQGRWLPDATTMSTLSDVGIVYQQNDVRASTQFGFATNPSPDTIATQVLSAASRFFILSVSGAAGGHSIGIHRPYSLIGKSSDAYLFDPNIGEFKVSGSANLSTLLAQLNVSGYQPIQIDLNQSYILWSYFYNPL